MAYDVDFQLQDDYVRLDVTGQRRPGDATVDAGAVIKQTVEFCRSVGSYRVLVILHLEGRLSPLDSYAMVEHAKQHGWTHAFRLAFVEKQREAFNDVRFTEIVASNRAYAIKAFTNEAEALDWLLEREPKESRSRDQAIGG